MNHKVEVRWFIEYMQDGPSHQVHVRVEGHITVASQYEKARPRSKLALALP